VSAETILARPFGTISELVRWHGAHRPEHGALVQDERRVTYGELDRRMDRIASGLRHQGIGTGERIAICAHNSIEYALLFLGAMRAGVVPALIPPNLPADTIEAMAADSGARALWRDDDLARLPDHGAPPAEPAIAPTHAFNIIYSSGTTGVPKGIVQPASMRWRHMQRGIANQVGPETTTLIATPLYSNTTLVAFFPALALGATVVVTGKFDAGEYLELAERHRATHTMLVPVQYQRILAVPGFDRHDLSSFRIKLSTSAPFGAQLKREVLDRWPGGLVEYYGTTEGGATCILAAHLHPDKLHTVGPPGPGVELKLIDEDGREVAKGEAGEVAGHSGAMMTGYHNRPEETAKAEWFDAAGKRYIRTGDVGRFDADGFLTLIDRRKDMIISGGFNVFPSDLEAVVRAHPAVAEVVVVGMASQRWGETPVAFVVPKGGGVEPGELLRWTNERLGKVQRLAALELVAELPRNAIGKVLKRTLREAWQGRLHL
jgi:acyl-CoA synthetase (AMP-forming)/AMP-acid ligase II